MYNNKKILAVITARGGSKRLANKNILDLDGKPLIVWSIDEANKSKYIDKSIMAPVIVQSTKKAEEKNSKEEFTKFKKELLNIRSFVEKNFENVGDKFSKEVRNLYYDKSKKKNIYGITTKEEREELEEEGIELASIPLLPPSKLGQTWNSNCHLLHFSRIRDGC